MAVFLKAHWENIIMANYVLPKELLMPYLPIGVELDLYNNEAYVSLVGFMFKRTKIFNLPIPFFGTFEEINLRFYVKRIDGNTLQRGVVFINETVPYEIVAVLANKLYNENYTTVKTKHSWQINQSVKKINYQWQLGNQWNSIGVNAENKPMPIIIGSEEEFIFEHYFGYAKLSNDKTEEYTIHHPSWNINKVINYDINCDFETMYGNQFACLNNIQPKSVFMAEGSSVEVNWKRTKIN
jgi:uncharacterized protein YqjF (DUF2071 family)